MTRAEGTPISATDAVGSRELGEALAADGRLLEAIDALTAANRSERDPVLERRLVTLRLEAFAELDRRSGARSWPPHARDAFRRVVGPPEVTRAELDGRKLRSGIVRHGCLLVRGLVDPARVDPLVDGIRRAFAGYDAHAGGAPVEDTEPWFVPFEPGNGSSLGLQWDPLIPRGWARDAAGVLAVDSPPMLFALLEVFEEAGVRELLTDYLEERPTLSVKKTTLRWARPDTPDHWHQDGAFLGRGVRSVNVWLALSQCGDDAPGIDLVARRFDRVVDAGTDDAEFDWSVGQGMVERAAEGAPIVRPIFEPGDALIFDDLLLHRTGVDPAMTRDRFAVESWFFAPSTYPVDQIPLVY